MSFLMALMIKDQENQHKGDIKDNIQEEMVGFAEQFTGATIRREIKSSIVSLLNLVQNQAKDQK